jgi:hypothetical protein
MMQTISNEVLSSFDGEATVYPSVGFKELSK